MTEEKISKSRIVIAAPKSGCGKTTVTLGLINALRKRGLLVDAFKCGPDYIDPLFHREVLKVPSGNLDTFFTEDPDTREIFLRESKGDIAVIEGVMGLFDGIGGIEEKGSTYDLARAVNGSKTDSMTAKIQTPMVLLLLIIYSPSYGNPEWACCRRG